MDHNLQIMVLVVLAVVAGIGAQVLASVLRLPSIVLLLTVGIGFGPSGLGWLHPQLLGDGLEVLVPLCVALILFEGGLTLELQRSEAEVTRSIRNLVTIGAVITLVGATLAAHWSGEFPWPIAVLYGSLVVVTGPTVVGPLLRQVGAERKLGAILEGEGILIDPLGAILAVVVLNLVLNHDLDPWSGLISLGTRLGVGTLIGWIAGWGLSWFLRQAQFLSDELRNLLVLASVWGTFTLSQVLVSESGLMTAVMLGITLRWAEIPGERVLRRFKGQLSTLAISVLFVLLAADLSVSSMVALGWGGLVTVLCLMFIVRPLSVFVSTWNSGLRWQQKAFLAWIAPRGIVAASVASLFSISLTNGGINGGDAIKALVFLTILLTVFGQGLTAKLWANFLQVRAHGNSGVIIVGCNPLGRLLGQLLHQWGEPVVMIDSNPTYCHQAQAEGLTVFVSSALNSEVLRQAGIENLGTFLAITSNPEVNRVLSQRIREEFDPPRVLAAFSRVNQSSNDITELSQGIEAALSQSLNVKDWNEYITADSIRLGEVTLTAERLEMQLAHLLALVKSEKLLPLLWIRQETVRVVQGDVEFQAGDQIVYLLHTPKPDFLLPSPVTRPLEIKTVLANAHLSFVEPKT
ncbi:cation:proton antiporter [Thermosynechococcaceae cyanobacterium BACA0444]|uniref:Cation:proton antiporter n=1 Tax=Pseudocalidococcus azoricus BACA0444 TaxID=2918990 RepID=A0AAE4FV28_9CYAN|nr:cation:proton antiporter [Pseudocalidococcus azoricus]MDS3861576.1 cation:proton antiporter [Pseudocalidococcus azoricus BACA0444]